ncbi:hypothetical protein GSI_14832 [Ganoderma sinense ZZ0214-1]|uniref:Alcohol acetyltransferase n=1 Tax=Ganoderma sinense ZZ0214-1 TaxID=1077348 RepID=A0A2G8RPT4_9APHY|nr:hypothetical protein GSI_14832 [Ganoderma sinense ZZ0214-1]
MSEEGRQGTKETTRAPPRHLRSVGRLEWFLFARTKARADSCVIVAARYLPSHSGDVINKAALYPALGEVVRENVALASRIAPASGRWRRPPEWVRLASLDLDRVVEFVNDDFSNLEAVFESQFRRGFDPDTDLPLWRLAALRDGTLIFAFDHTLCDGLGGLAFHRMLLAALQANRTSPTSVVFAEDQNLPPPLEDATSVSVPWRTVFRETLKCLNPFAWRRHLTTWAGNRIPPSFELDTRVHILTYCPAEARRLRALAGAHKATLTATLHTLALLVLSRLLDTHFHRKFTSTTTYVPIWLRRATGAAPDDFCNHYSYVFSSHKLFSGPVLRFGEDSDDGGREGDGGPSSFPWADAAHFSEKLRAAAPRAASAMGLLKLVGSPGRRGGFVRRALGHRRIIGLELANLDSFAPGLGEVQEELEGEGEREELEGRRAVEVVPTPAVAVAETVKSQEAERAAGEAPTAAVRGAETTEGASPTAIAIPAERTDTAETDGGGGDLHEQFATPLASMPESPISPARVAQFPTETAQGHINEVTPTGRETIDGAPVAGDKDSEIPPQMSASSPHGSRTDLAAPRTATPSRPLAEGISHEQHAYDDALNINIPAPESGDTATSPQPEPASSVQPPESTMNVDPDSNIDGYGGPAHEYTMAAKEAASTAAPHRDTADSGVRTEAPPPPPALARGRSNSEGGTSPRVPDRLRDERTKLELVSPHAPTGDADPPHADAPTPTPTPATQADADAFGYHCDPPAPTGHGRNANTDTVPVANSHPTPHAGSGSDSRSGAPPGPDNAGAPGQARRVGNVFPTHHWQEPPGRHGESETHQVQGQGPPQLWRLREVLYAQADGTLGAALKVCVTGTPEGGLGVAISWGASAVDEEFGKEFVVGFADGVRELTVDHGHEHEHEHGEHEHDGSDAGVGGQPGVETQSAVTTTT